MNFSFSELFCFFGGFLGLILMVVILTKMAGNPLAKYSINTYRIEAAKKLLISPEYSKLTINAIAQKAGFNSKSPFYNAFNKHTGMTPKAFIKLQGNTRTPTFLVF